MIPVSGGVADKTISLIEACETSAATSSHPVLRAEVLFEAERALVLVPRHVSSFPVWPSSVIRTTVLPRHHL
jgi:hypothetical protein